MAGKDMPGKWGSQARLQICVQVQRDVLGVSEAVRRRSVVSFLKVLEHLRRLHASVTLSSL